jgi:hypothetical protein
MAGAFNVVVVLREPRPIAEELPLLPGLKLLLLLLLLSDGNVAVGVEEEAEGIDEGDCLEKVKAFKSLERLVTADNVLDNDGRC